MQVKERPGLLSWRASRPPAVVGANQDWLCPAPFLHRGSDAGDLLAAVRARIYSPPRNQPLDRPALDRRVDFYRSWRAPSLPIHPSIAIAGFRPGLTKDSGNSAEMERCFPLGWSQPWNVKGRCEADFRGTRKDFRSGLSGYLGLQLSFWWARDSWSRWHASVLVGALELARASRIGRAGYSLCSPSSSVSNTSTCGMRVPMCVNTRTL